MDRQSQQPPADGSTKGTSRRAFMRNAGLAGAGAAALSAAGGASVAGAGSAAAATSRARHGRQLLAVGRAESSLSTLVMIERWNGKSWSAGQAGDESGPPAPS